MRPMTQPMANPSPVSKPDQAPPLVCSSEFPKANPDDAGSFRLNLSKTEIRAGEEIAITIDTRRQVTRGVDSYLECWNGKGWVTKYLLLTSYSSDMEPSSSPYPAGVIIVDLGLSGPGPERIRLPNDLEPGWYRIRKTFSLDDSDQYEGYYVSHTAYGRLRVIS